jgi:AmmeMemoRadiSam system protein A
MQASLISEPVRNAELIFRDDHKEMLRAVARRSIEHGLRFGRPLAVDPKEYPPPLAELKAVFVTLRHGAELRGCLGTLEAAQPLVSGGAKYAFAAAFSDPRFGSVTEAELLGLRIQISVLSEPEPIPFNSESELIEQLRPGIDGLVLRHWWHRGTLLPSVWEEIPEPREFLAKLKQKAGLSPDYWSRSMEVKRYTAVCF